MRESRKLTHGLASILAKWRKMTKFYQFLRDILVFEEKWRKRAKYYTSFALCQKCAILGSKFRLVQFYHRAEGDNSIKAGWAACGKTWPGKCQWGPHRDWWDAFVPVKRLNTILYLLNLLYLLNVFVAFVCLWGETVLAKPLSLQVPAKKAADSRPIELLLFCLLFTKSLASLFKISFNKLWKVDLAWND